MFHFFQNRKIEPEKNRTETRKYTTNYLYKLLFDPNKSIIIFPPLHYLMKNFYQHIKITTNYTKILNNLKIK